MSEWRPISEYQPQPFDADRWYMPGERVLVWNGHWVEIAAYGYTAKGQGRWRDTVRRLCYPTHWMPLPEPPAQPT